MQGKIIKGIAGFYYVHAVNNGVYECMAKGIFRNRKVKPLVGDNVEIDIIDEKEHTGNITEIFSRANELIRPAVANIDQALIVFAPVSPALDYNLLSRFLVMMDYNGIGTVICINKTDLADKGTLSGITEAFSKSGCKIFATSTKSGEGMEELKEALTGKTTAFAGPSGVGKSSILNKIFPDACSKTGTVSEKIKRGRHTTRHTELFNLGEKTYIMDTPGFTSLDYSVIKEDSLRLHFNEFKEYEGKCRYKGCVHVNEPDCAVKHAVEAGIISRIRYSIYTDMYNELKNKRKY